MNDPQFGNERQVSTAVGSAPALEAAINCGFYFVVLLAAVALDRAFPYQNAVTYTVVLLPYLLIVGFILLRRSMRAPWFMVGDAGALLSRFVLVWAGLALIACMFAFYNGLMRPLPPGGGLNLVATIVGVPVTEELVFRAALLTSLNKTGLGAMQILRVPVSVIAGAAIFSVLHCMIYAAAGFGAMDVLVSGGTALIMGVAFGVIYVKTGNVWYGVFLHMLINFGQWT